MKNLLPSCAALIFGTAAALNAAPVLLDFETAGEFTDNFRVLNSNGTLSQTDNGDGDDFMTSVLSTGASMMYDADGSAPGISTFVVSESTPITISADVRFSTDNNSFGIYIVNAANEAQGYLALFTIDASGSTDKIQFASNGIPTTAGAGTLANGSFASDADVGFSNNAFNSVSLTYSINGSNNPVLTMTAGSQASSITLSSITTPFTEVEIGFRMRSASGTISMDNLNITSAAIPEPSTYAALFGVAALGFCVLRRRVTR